MRAVGLVVALLALGGCRDETPAVPPDLSAPSLYCPPAPPAAGAFVCDPTSIPFCTYPTQSQTCLCTRGGDGTYTLTCGEELQPDGGLPTGTRPATPMPRS
jgi:hypothetical protein